MFKKILTLLAVNLRMFDTLPNTQTTASSGLSAENKTYYDKNLIRNAVPYLIHDQFGQKRPIPKNGGKTIEFRRYAPLAKALVPLTEGVTPNGNSLTVSTITATIAQYGDYITLSDMLIMTAIDNNLVEAGVLLGQQSGETLDTVTREVLNAGTNVQYSDGAIAARYLLVGGDATAANNHYMGVAASKAAVRTLKRNKAKKIKGNYIAIIHTDIAHDLTNDTKWEEAAKYAGSTQIFEGEIGRLYGVRYIETTEAKVFYAADLVTITNKARNLTCASVAVKTFTIAEALSAAEATALVGRKLIIKGYKYTVASAAAGAAGAATITVSETVAGTPTTDVIYPGEAGAKGRSVYSTLFLGENAYGVTEVEGGGLRNIVKQLGSSGTADALDQRATSGWKAVKTAEILVEEYMVRVETTSSYDADKAN